MELGLYLFRSGIDVREKPDIYEARDLCLEPHQNEHGCNPGEKWPESEQ